jgi:hypothetical protein
LLPLVLGKENRRLRVAVLALWGVALVQFVVLQSAPGTGTGGCIARTSCSMR